MKMNRHTQRCFNDHMGHWMMDDARFHQLYAFIMSENIVFEADKHDPEEDEEERRRERDALLAPITAGGAMIVPVTGTMMRGVSSFGGTSTVQIRRILRQGARNPEVNGAFMRFDTPGGTVAGNDELADEIRAFGRVKPIVAHVDNMMASAGFWAGAQTHRITATRTSEIGSLGTVAVVRDFSENLEKEGIKTHVISTGKFKGAFTPGSEITKEQVADLQEKVDNLNVFFKEAVMSGRNMDQKTVDKLFDGRMHLAEDAQKLGLIDEVMSFDEALRKFEQQIFNADEDIAMAKARFRLAQSRHLL